MVNWKINPDMVLTRQNIRGVIFLPLGVDLFNSSFV